MQGTGMSDMRRQLGTHRRTGFVRPCYAPTTGRELSGRYCEDAKWVPRGIGLPIPQWGLSVAALARVLRHKSHCRLRTIHPLP